MWDLPGPGLEPVSPVLAGGFLTTVPPRKSLFLGSFSRHMISDVWVLAGCYLIFCSWLLVFGFLEASDNFWQRMFLLKSNH